MYHADLVSGQPIQDGDEVVAFLLERKVHAHPDAMPLEPSHDYRVASLPIPGIFREGGELEPTKGFELDYTRQCLQHSYQSVGESLMELVKGKLAIAFMRLSTYRLLLEVSNRENVFNCLEEALAMHTRMMQWLASPKSTEFLDLREKLEEDLHAYMEVLSSSRSLEEVKSHPVTRRLEEGKRQLGPGVYDRYHDIFQVFFYFNGPGRVCDPETGERFQVPAPWNAFSGSHIGQCLSPLLSECVSEIEDRTLLLKPLLEIKQLDGALTLLGRFWTPSMYLGDWRCDATRAFYFEKLAEQANLNNSQR